ncbi:hypothetical protein NDU88_004206 [Pleurodeles waltl]|uniref:Uncharacterized protein n=1 Tax=Pleurodeles waltl TaxID=8319 RepID=A0AAV7UEM4_PLEWA|nr:hypothetical protein NDU88_004206 [Pleurodeles waltl]
MGLCMGTPAVPVPCEWALQWPPSLPYHQPFHGGVYRHGQADGWGLVIPRAELPWWITTAGTTRLQAGDSLAVSAVLPSRVCLSHNEATGDATGQWTAPGAGVSPCGECPHEALMTHLRPGMYWFSPRPRAVLDNKEAWLAKELVRGDRGNE